MRKHAIIYLNGKYLQVHQKTLEVFTPGVFKGKGVFETLLAIGHKVFDADLHLRRLHKAFKGVKVSAKTIEEVVKRNRFDTTRVRVLAWSQGRQRHVAVMALKYNLPKDKEYRVCLIKTDRKANARLANVKSLDYALFADAYHQACAKGFDEALLLNEKGHIFEASRANIFWVMDGKLYTPPLSSGCLNGITRSKIINNSKKLKIPVYEKNFSPHVLKKAQALFLTNSLIGIQRVKNFLSLLPR